MFANQYAGKKVFVTGHTGFKGSWLTQWLLDLGAEVTGFSDRVLPAPSLFTSLGLARQTGRFVHVIGDVRDAAALKEAMGSCAPGFVFHLAAQAIVRHSYQAPAETFDVNLMGTVNVLEAVRRLDRPVNVVIVTSDKCYDNKEWVHSYREEDPLGGFDPYSASKGCAELAVNCWRRSFFHDNRIRVASARAGNVIGGGDWAANRIVPDCIRALCSEQPVPVRSPHAIRPWQHVLEPLSGYLWLGASLAARGADCCTAYNFGPEVKSHRSVSALVAEVLRHWPGKWIDCSDPAAPHEAAWLSLAIDKSFHHLNWRPVWPFETSVEVATRWYRDVAAEGNPLDGVRRDIARYCADAAHGGLPWAEG
jgi:CDP-glucose 4,6-dehydratase